MSINIVVVCRLWPMGVILCVCTTRAYLLYEVIRENWVLVVLRSNKYICLQH